MEKINLSFETYPTELEEKVAEKLGLKIIETIIYCGLWEEKECTFITNYLSSSEFCEHSQQMAEVEYSWGFFNSKERNKRTEIFYSTPRVLIAINEGGHNSTGICVDCLMENL